MTDAVHCCSKCDFTCVSETELLCHQNVAHDNMNKAPVAASPSASHERSTDGAHQHSPATSPISSSPSPSPPSPPSSSSPSTCCPLCQSFVSDRPKLECHLLQIHNATPEGLNHLLHLLPNPGRSLTGAHRRDVASSLVATRAAAAAASSSSAATSSDVDLEYHRQNGSDISGKDNARSDTAAAMAATVTAAQGFLCWWKGCNQYFTTLSAVKTHFREIHAKSVPLLSTSPPSPPPPAAPCLTETTSTSTATVTPSSVGQISERHLYPFRCGQCSLAFRTRDKLSFHQQYHAMRAATRCVVCSRSFRTVGHLRRHMQSEHVPLTSVDNLQQKESPPVDSTVGAAASGGTVAHGDTHSDDGADSSPAASPDVAQSGEECKENRVSSSDSADRDRDRDRERERDHADDYLNSPNVAENAYLMDMSRRFRCHRCKMAFTKQSYLTIHNRTVLHRRGEKVIYSMEKFLDPARPYKCEICRESFTQKNILLVHFNSVSHLNRLKKSLLDLQSSNGHLSPSTLAVLNKYSSMYSSAVMQNATTAVTPANVAAATAVVKSPSANGTGPNDEDDHLKQTGIEFVAKKYKCNICAKAYNTGQNLDIHLRSVGHHARIAKLQELITGGEIDLSRPFLEQPSGLVAKPPPHTSMVVGSSISTSAGAGDTLSLSKQHVSAKTKADKTEHAFPVDPLRCFGLTRQPASMNVPLLASFLASQSFQQPQLFPLMHGQSSVTLVDGGPLICDFCSCRFGNCEELRQHERHCPAICDPAFAVSDQTAASPGIGVNGEFASTGQQPSAIEMALQTSNRMSTWRIARGNMFKTLLEDYGFEVVMQYNEVQHARRRNVIVTDDSYEPQLKRTKHSDEETNTIKSDHHTAVVDSPQAVLTEFSRCTCVFCGLQFSSIWILKAHLEQVHRKLVPLDEVEKLGDDFKVAYDKKYAESGVSSFVASSDPGDLSDSAAIAAVATANCGQLGNSGNGKQVLPSSVAAGHYPFGDVSTAAIAQNMQNLASLGFGIPFPFVGMPLSAYGVLNSYMSLLAVRNYEAWNGRAAAAAAAAAAAVAAAESLTAASPAGGAVVSGGSGSKPLMTPATQNAAALSSLLLQQQQQQQQKRARTRITDEQLKILREYFDINNSPTEEQVEEMSRKSGLPQKVIKHWFRNTLFKERQRSKDSPYNFSIPPSCGIDLEEYEKTGETKVIPLTTGGDVKQDASPACRIGEKHATDDSGNKPLPVDRAEAKENEKNEAHDARSTRGDSAADNGNSTSIAAAVKQEQFTESPLKSSSNDGQLSNAESSKSDEEQFQSCGSCAGSGAATGSAGNVGCGAPGVGTGFSAQDVLRKLSSMAPLPFPLSTAAAAPAAFLSSPIGIPTQNFSTPTSAGASFIGHSITSSMPISPAGRRANRTRFTEQQVKVLQSFFEKNAYPKDDDLELLSKRLGLSPRVIVVWFQNARQKARKIFENQPMDTDDRFTRTPGMNYQCKNCKLVFQRYYELIKHQKASCLRGIDVGRGLSDVTDDSGATSPSSLATVTVKSEPNDFGFDAVCNVCSARFLDLDALSEHVRTHESSGSGPTTGHGHGHGYHGHGSVSSASTAVLAGIGNGEELVSLPHSSSSSVESSSAAQLSDEELCKRQRAHISPQHLYVLYQSYKNDPNPTGEKVLEISKETGMNKRAIQVWFQNTRAKERRSQMAGGQHFFNKRCPFCGILFHSKQTMELHFAERHKQQCAKVDVNIDQLPDAEEVPTITTFPLPATLLNLNKIRGGSPSGNSGGGHDGGGQFTQASYQNSISRRRSEGCDSMENYDTFGSAEFKAIDMKCGSSSASSAGNEEFPLDLSRSVKSEVDFSGVLGSGANGSGNGGTVGSEACPLRRGDTLRMINRTSSASNEDAMSHVSCEDPDDGRFGASGGGGGSQSQSCGSSPSSQHRLLATLARPQKRFRTHLTPHQVKVMKHLFEDYKTPTMSECEMLGMQIGLHKRVVQVWFQNARAKERKISVPTTGAAGTAISSSSASSCKDSTQESGKPMVAQCTLCNRLYEPRFTLQDHVFTKEHIDRVKILVDKQQDAQMASGVTNSYASPASASRSDHLNMSTAEVVGADGSQVGFDSIGGGGRLGGSYPLTDKSQRSSGKTVASTVDREDQEQQEALNAAVTQNLLPYIYSSGVVPPAAYYSPLPPSLMCPAGYAGFPSAGFIYDPNIHGTPVSLLQIPSSVMELIVTTMQNGASSSCRFTQDGKTIDQLTKSLGFKDKTCVAERDMVVGWACSKCTTVFQSEQLFCNHQQLICHSTEPAFRLVQTHYECTLCNVRFGIQTEFKQHCTSAMHVQNLADNNL